MKYCNACDRMVQPSKKFSIGWFLVNCIWIIGGPGYVLYWALLKGKKCPICGNGHLSSHK